MLNIDWTPLCLTACLDGVCVAKISGCVCCVSVCCVCIAVQNERDRISVRRRPSFDDIGQMAALSVNTLHSAELLARQVSECVSAWICIAHSHQ